MRDEALAELRRVGAWDTDAELVTMLDGVRETAKLGCAIYDGDYVAAVTACALVLLQEEGQR